MQQVFFRLPFVDWPIFGYGLMLFLAFIACTWLAGRRGERVGMKKETLQDFAICMFVGGLIGARVFYFFPELRRWPVSVWEFISIWEGGLVFYGGVVGALAAYVLLYLFSLRKQGISTLKLADVVAPSLAVGVALGRVGCFLNGCCYGAVACPDCSVYPVHFPLSAPARYALVDAGVQTAAGFTVDEAYRDPGVRVDKVDLASALFAAGLRSGDVIEEADGKKMSGADDLSNYLGDFKKWPQGKTDLTLKVRDKENQEKTFTVAPRTVGLHPAELYETTSMFIVLLLLFAYEPFKTRDGQVMVLMMMAYAIHRFVNEMLRDDPRPVGFERYSSVFLFGAALLMGLWLLTRPAQYKPSWTVPAPA